MFFKKGTIISYLSITILCLFGCGTIETKNDAVHQQDVLGYSLEEERNPIPEEGSLWTETGGTLLFGDQRARQIGDLVTVRISESPNAELSARTETSRDSSISAGIPHFFGVMENYGENHHLDPSKMIEANMANDFKGEGTNNRSGELEAYITARVIQVLTNGNLRICGKQEIKVNNETQFISLSGIIRPEDISTSNEVQSTQVADAHIVYTGMGAIADKQKPGWLMRSVDFIWPF
jgi:flagellar L-ring protein precursor FlgH